MQGGQHQNHTDYSKSQTAHKTILHPEALHIASFFPGRSDGQPHLTNAKRIAEKERAIAEAEKERAQRAEQFWRLKRRDNQDIESAIEELSKLQGSQKTIDALEKALKKLRGEHKRQ